LTTTAIVTNPRHDHEVDTWWIWNFTCCMRERHRLKNHVK
jgi:hypothetical protein